MCRTDGGDGPAVSSTTTQKARKTHKCGECGREIQPGETYTRTWGIWDGFASTYKTCSHCAIPEEWLAINCDGYIFGEIIDDIDEHGRDYQRADLRALAAGAAKKWRTDDGLLMPVPPLPPRLSLNGEGKP